LQLAPVSYTLNFTRKIKKVRKFNKKADSPPKNHTKSSQILQNEVKKGAAEPTAPDL